MALLLPALILSGCAHRAAPWPASGDAALVVAFSRYEHLPPRPAAAAGAEVFSTWLRGPGGLAEDHLHRVVSAADLPATWRAAIADVAPGGRLWVYVAGHAVGVDEHGNGVLMLPDAPPDPVVPSPHAVLLARLAHPGAVPTTIVADTCDLGAMPADRRHWLPQRRPREDDQLTVWTGGACPGGAGPAQDDRFTRAVVASRGRRTPPHPTPPAEDIGAFFVFSDPVGAEVALDGEPTCRAPCVRLLPRGEHDATVRWPDGSAQSIGMDLSAQAVFRAARATVVRPVVATEDAALHTLAVRLIDGLDGRAPDGRLTEEIAARRADLLLDEHRRHRDAGDAEAATLLDEAEAILRATPPVDGQHFQLARVQLLLARELIAYGQHARAADLVRPVAALEDHPDGPLARYTLAWLEVRDPAALAVRLRALTLEPLPGELALAIDADLAALGAGS